MHKQTKEYLIQAGLFLVTFLTTTLSGMDWTGAKSFDWEGISKGLMFSVPFLGILTVHEFGHYIASRIYKLKVTLPFYIPFYIPIAGFLSIGTLGAFIRIKSPLKSKREVMDVGIAGPLAGFIIALGVLFYGFSNLPSKESIYDIHPEYQVYGLDYEKEVYTYQFSRSMDSLSYLHFNENNIANWEPQKEYSTMALGKNLLLLFFENYVASDPELIPNKYEMFHYPFIFAGFLALFFTALNLLPIGQLDGGHITFGLLGSKNHYRLSLVIFIGLVYFGGVGIFRNNIVGNVFGSIENLFFFGPLYLFFLYFIFGKVSENWKNNLLLASMVFAAQFFTEMLFPSYHGISALYLFFGFLLGRFLGIAHPPTYVEERVSLGRKILGWVSLIIFILCFTPDLFVVETFKP